MISERGEVAPKLLGKHQGRAHKLSNEPGSPHIFYTCGEDGLVQHVSHYTFGYIMLYYISTSFFELANWCYVNISRS